MLIKKAVASAVFANALFLAPVFAAAPVVEVFKTKTCGCCAKWVEHLKANGFAPKVIEVDNTADARQKNGVPEGLRSCHTATVGGYTLEGHVPAADVHRLLKSKAKIKGLAVPGMPQGSPGMETGRKDKYSVLSFDAQGKSAVYQTYAGD